MTRVVFGALLIPVVLSSSAVLDSARAAEVVVRDGRVSIHAEDEPLEPLLRELSVKTGAMLHLHTSVEQRITVSLEAVPLERAFDHLLGREVNVVFVYPNGRPGGLPAEIWIFGGASRVVSEDAEPIEPAAGPVAEGDPHNPTQNIGSEFDANPWAAWQSARWHPDPKVQRHAIAHLGQQATTIALEALLALLEDRQSWVRQSALEALGPLVQRHRRVREAIVSIMERSGDLDTRQLLADSISGSEDDDAPGESSVHGSTRVAN